MNGDQSATAMTAVSRLPSHHCSASGSWHRTFFCCSGRPSITVTNTVDTELIAHFADCKTYSENSGLIWVTNANKYPLLAPLPQDLLSAPASEAHVESVFSVCGELTAGKRNRLNESLKRIMLKMNLKYYA